MQDTSTELVLLTLGQRAMTSVKNKGCAHAVILCICTKQNKMKLCVWKFFRALALPVMEYSALGIRTGFEFHLFITAGPNEFIWCIYPYTPRLFFGPGVILPLANGIYALCLDIMVASLQMTFSSACSSTKMIEFRLQFHWQLFPRV